MACYRVTAKAFMFILGMMFWAVAGGLFYVGGYIFYSHGHIDEIAISKLVLVPGVDLDSKVFLGQSVAQYFAWTLSIL